MQSGQINEWSNIGFAATIVAAIVSAFLGSWVGAFTALFQFKKDRAFDRQLVWYENMITALHDMAQKIDIAVTFQEESGTDAGSLRRHWHRVQRAHLVLERSAIQAPLYASDLGLNVAKKILGQVQKVANSTEAFDLEACKEGSIEEHVKLIDDLSDKLMAATEPLAKEARSKLGVK